MHKRPHPDAHVFFQAQPDVVFDDAEHVDKRRRCSLGVRRDKRERESPAEPLYNAVDLEHARVEGRMQVLARCEAALSANDALRKAMSQITEERDRLAHDNRILKAGVCSLNAKREQLLRQLDETNHMLHDLTARYQDLERAIAMHNMQVGACRRDETSNFYGGGGRDDGDVF